MDLKSLAKKIFNNANMDTLAMVTMVGLTGYWLHASLMASNVSELLWGLGFTLVFAVFAGIDIRRRDKRRDAALVMRIVEEGECQDGECCSTEGQDDDCCGGHCEMEDEPDTEAKPEKKVC